MKPVGLWICTVALGLSALTYGAEHEASANDPFSPTVTREESVLLDTDARWGIISESVDCRTPAERGLRSDPQPELAAKGQRRIFKSRYDSISTYIYQGAYTGAADEEVNSKKKRGLKNRC